MDTQTIDQEFEKLQTEFQDVAGTVTSLAQKLQAAEAAGDGNATEWLSDLKQVAKDIDDEQAQAHALLLAIHGFITNLATAQAAAPPAQPDEHPPLFAPGHEPQDQDDQQGQTPQRHGILGGMFGGGMGGGMMGGGMMGGMGGGMMMGGYGGGGFARAMEMGAGMSLGANLLNSIFR
jgi:hypothetical protein